MASGDELKMEGATPFSRCQMYDVNYTEILESGIRVANTSWAVTKCKNGWSFNYTNIPYASIAAEVSVFKDNENNRCERNRKSITHHCYLPDYSWNGFATKLTFLLQPSRHFLPVAYWAVSSSATSLITTDVFPLWYHVMLLVSSRLSPRSLPIAFGHSVSVDSSLEQLSTIASTFSSLSVRIESGIRYSP